MGSAIPIQYGQDGTVRSSITTLPSPSLAAAKDINLITTKSLDHTKTIVGIKRVLLDSMSYIQSIVLCVCVFQYCLYVLTRVG